MAELEAGWLRGIERGERTALEALARHYAAPVYRYLCRLTGDATLAEDLAQEVAVQLWRALPGRRFPNARALNAWVYTVAMNAFRMHRRRVKAGEVSWDGALELPAGEESNPLRAAEREDLARRVRAAVAELPEAERQAVLLKAFADLRYTDIAQATGEPVGTVKWRVSQAYRKLRTLLQGDLAGSGSDHEESARVSASTPSLEAAGARTRKREREHGTMQAVAGALGALSGRGT